MARHPEDAVLDGKGVLGACSGGRRQQQEAEGRCSALLVQQAWEQCWYSTAVCAAAGSMPSASSEACACCMHIMPHTARAHLHVAVHQAGRVDEIDARERALLAGRHLQGNGERAAASAGARHCGRWRRCSHCPGRLRRTATAAHITDARAAPEAAAAAALRLREPGWLLSGRRRCCLLPLLLAATLLRRASVNRLASSPSNWPKSSR